MLANLNSFQNLTKIDVVLTGAWKSPIAGNPIWQGEATAETSIVSIIFLTCNDRNFWAKSSLSATNKLEIELFLHPTFGDKVQFIYSIGSASNWIQNATATLSPKDYLPEFLPLRTVQTGTLVTIARFN